MRTMAHSVVTVRRIANWQLKMHERRVNADSDTNRKCNAGLLNEWCFDQTERMKRNYVNLFVGKCCDSGSRFACRWMSFYSIRCGNRDFWCAWIWPILCKKHHRLLMRWQWFRIPLLHMRRSISQQLLLHQKSTTITRHPRNERNIKQYN